MTWDYRQNLRSVTNHLNLENGRFFISNFMWLNFQNLVARYSGGRACFSGGVQSYFLDYAAGDCGDFP